MKRKNKAQRVALLKTLLVFLLLGAGCVIVVVWAAKTEDSDLARSLRVAIGLPEPKSQSVTPDESVPVVTELPVAEEPVTVAEVPDPEPLVTPDPEPLPIITFKEIAAQRHLWPDTLRLKLDVRVPIRYNGKDYGFMEFRKGVTLEVDAVSSGGEIFCRIDGNYLSLSVYETDFYGWFKGKYSEQYDVQPVTVDLGSKASSRYRLGTEKGEAAFWAEMRIWCHQNYEAVSLTVEEDGLVFKWLPTEDVPIDYSVEAREIARQFLLKRAKYGGRENYAACEIRHPVTDELLGASSIFIPRL
ncbi:hypothetical protein QEH59_01895 [Coraliomargarita sp. SDUM461004]|uniref:DUF4412 domain-containing protein n=1 Tax=Thalassobacterium sedimentorum TaxID=3041258 RepID=A0ABU1AEG4_9BACT|nr:hypothetical protein [Coraliomargarita sp. SDUM461004]MDQ8193160.1 hypothetical protein [Coraliomargarita sp. SDUM461004]